MRLVKVNNEFYKKCTQNNTTEELMFNEQGRPCVLIVRLKYKNKKRDFIVPLRSNIPASAPTWQYFSLPPNNNTKPGNKHGIHYIKLFPISKKYINKYNINNNDFFQIISEKISNNQKEIIDACQKYLVDCELGKKHPMTPNIDGILEWIDNE